MQTVFFDFANPVADLCQQAGDLFFQALQAVNDVIVCIMAGDIGILARLVDDLGGTGLCTFDNGFSFDNLVFYLNNFSQP